MTVHERHFRALSFAPRTVDDDARTVELIAATGAAVERRDLEGPYLEILPPGVVDPSRVDGMPLLDSHRQDGLDRVIGVVRELRIEQGQLIARVQISERHEAIWRDIKAGIIRNVSVGYSVDDFEDRIDPATGQRVRTVTKWTLYEISLVPVAADNGAKTRGQMTMPNETSAPEARAATPPENAMQATAAPETVQEIRALAETLNLGTDFAEEMIAAGASVEGARAAAQLRVTRATARPSPQARVTIGADHSDPAAIVQRAGEALYARANPRHQLSEPARPYANLTTLDIARDCLRRAGLQTTALSPIETITRALHTTSDFPLIFADTANRALRAAYDAAPATLKQAARQTTAKDFRAKTSVQLGEAPTLEKVNEHGEYQYGSMAEAAESYKIDTFGKIIGLTRKAIVNDDLGAFTDLAAKLGQAAAEFEAQFLVDLLESGAGNGPTMSDGNPLFHATAHKNKAASGAAPDETTLSDARLAMRKQKGLSDKPINVTPRFLLVAPDLETVAEKLLAAIQPTKSDDVNPFGGKLDLLVEARLSSTTRWYLIADPARIEGLEYAYLQGAEGPQTETRAGFEIDGVEVKVRLDFGAAFLDWRSWYLNPGA